jgi:RHS repeat-associated protein
MKGIVWNAGYSAFGETNILIEAVENPLRYPGQYYDKETGLHYNYLRYYSPRVGRYITPDPIGLAGGNNPYVYVGNNPMNKIDPFGLVEGSACPRKSCWERYWEEVERNRVPGAEFFGLPTGFISGSLTALSFAGPWAAEQLAQRGATGAFESQKLARNAIYLKNYFPRLLSVGTAARLVGRASLVVTVFYVSADVTTLLYTWITFECKD